MAVSRWLCSSTKNMVVKIVHPGGRVELYDRPVLVNEILVRNPRCCVAHPHVFKQPWAVVSWQTRLMPGQTFYVVPISTVRKLQKLFLKHSPNLFCEMQAAESYDDRVPEAEAFPCRICSSKKTYRKLMFRFLFCIFPLRPIFRKAETYKSFGKPMMMW